MPTDLGSIASLQTLHLANNSLTGSIPTTLVDLSDLRSLSLAGNRFSGCIPNALARVAQNDLSDIELSFCDPVTPTATPPATATPTAPVGQADLPAAWCISECIGPLRLAKGRESHHGSPFNCQ